MNVADLEVGDPILVEWFDPQLFCDWDPDEKKLKSLSAFSLGWFHSLKEGELRYAMDRDKNGVWGSVMVVPMGCVTNITRLGAREETCQVISGMIPVKQDQDGS